MFLADIVNAWMASIRSFELSTFHSLVVVSPKAPGIDIVFDLVLAASGSNVLPQTIGGSVPIRSSGVARWMVLGGPLLQLRTPHHYFIGCGF